MAWSSIELHNFRHYVKTTPKHLLGKAPPDNPTHAYDAKNGALDHGFSRPIRRQDFSRNGIFDHSRGRMARDEETTATKRDTLALIRTLAKALSPEDWADVQRYFRSKDTDAEDNHDLATLPTRKVDWRPNNRTNQTDSEAARQAMDELHERIPGLKSIKVGTGDRLQEIDPRRVLNQKPPIAMDSTERQRVVEGIEKFAPGFAAVKIGPL